ncbi:FHA domain-containing protein [Xylanimonas sp. McL0601]|uniref:FHA domain-containing protein n=1 Tax=Xylanimonas sp. McL0601 TaxID=3414739 RepID=UPI003CE74D47
MTATTSAAAWYTGSGGTVVRRARTLVLLADEPAAAARRVWDGVTAQSPVTAVLDALAGLPGTSLTTLPPFAAVTLADDGTAHVLVRGGFCAALGTASGVVVVDGAEVTTWQERRVAGVATVTLGTRVRAASEVVADPGAWPLGEGVVRAGEVAWEAAADGARAAGPSAASAGAPAALAVAPAAPAAAPAAPPRVVAWPLPGAGSRPQLTVPDVETVLPEPKPEPEPEPKPEPEPYQELGSAPAPEATQAGPVDLGDDGYAHLWGATVIRTVEDAAVRPEDDDEPDDAPTAALVPAPVPPTPHPAPAPPVPPTEPAEPAEPTAAAPLTAALISGVPRSWGGAADPEPARREVPEPDGTDHDGTDHDGHTVMSSALAHLRSGAAPEPAPAPTPSLAAGPQVLARTCPVGHANPPSRDACRTCGVPLEGEAHPATRPVLGRIRVAGGPQVELDRPLVVGRRPRTPRSTAGEMPRLVTVASPNQDVSRSHVEVRLEGWHVLVTDLATTNGTVLHRGSQPPQRLHPGEATLVVDGDVVDLGDGATLTFEEIW